MSNVSLAVSVQIDTSVIDALAAAAPAKAKQALLKGGFMIEGDAKQMAPIDTGALKSSIETKDAGPLLVIVQDGVTYGIWQELGTSKMAAQPFMIPALEKNADEIRSLIAQVITT